MGASIICNGCGARLTIPDDYPRNKMQCPECGVMCPVSPRPALKTPASESRPAANSPASESRPAEEAAIIEDAPAPVRSPPPLHPTAIVEAPTPAGKGLAHCPHCGELVRVPERKIGWRGQCPACERDWPTVKKKPPPPRLPVPPPPDEFAGSTPDEDPESSNPYRTADAGGRRCPGCGDRLGPEIVLCVRCGFDLREGRKHVKEYGKFERSWDSGMPTRTRWVLFLLCQSVALISIGLAFFTVTSDDSLSVAVTTFVFSWMVYTGMTAFLLGTYDHVYIRRYKSGRVDLIKTLKVAFIPCTPREIDVRDYFGVSGGRMANVGAWDWFICLILFLSGVFPAVIWWYCTIHKVVHTVWLTNEHGAPEVLVYRGWGEEIMKEIEHALQTALTL